mmetsp:Transcript_79712/g.131865  ORF Transcript_79712/g.131865 Transcript_79712/m.131865 type:complete len:108 (+) Transcript_79712:40-363(+)
MAELTSETPPPPPPPPVSDLAPNLRVDQGQAEMSTSTALVAATAPAPTAEYERWSGEASSESWGESGWGDPFTSENQESWDNSSVKSDTAVPVSELPADILQLSQMS